jgi:folate-dependent phosphoribosylglycinamide formyltransferase PurN
VAYRAFFALPETIATSGGFPTNAHNPKGNKMINIHPALLPSFGGKGMYGMNVHKAVFESSAKVSGATVHFVNEVYDSGTIIMQRCVDISSAESPEEIAAMVLRIEHEILPKTILKFAENKIQIKNNRIYIID